MKITQWRTGEELVRTCLRQGDNIWKRMLIPHKPRGERSNPAGEGLAFYQLVGGVKAHLGEDG